MTITEQVENRYKAAIAEIERVMAAGPQTTHQRYDYKKAILRTGKPPKKYTAGFEKMRHELQHECRQVLKGVQEAKDFLQTHEELGLDPDWVEEVFGDVQSAIERSTKTSSEGEN